VKALVLAAGYATRLYPLTRERPKHLLPVAGRPMLEHVLECLGAIEELDGLYLVTNSKFAGQFADWAAGYEPPRPELRPQVIDDGTRDESDRLGAIGDLAFVLETQGIDEDLIVLAGDNLFSENLDGFGRAVREREAPVLALYDVGDLEAIRQYNSIEVDAEGRVVYFEEKPAEPRSTLIGVALYYYPRSVLPLVERYLSEGNNPDQPGRFVQWLYPQLEVYTWPLPGLWFDIGSREMLAEADRIFAQS
jgi:glucose-1-phosphate thymidylyltransferase